MSNLTAQADALLTESAAAVGSNSARSMQLSINHISAFLSNYGAALDEEDPGRVTSLGYAVDDMAYRIQNGRDARERNPFDEALGAFSGSVKGDLKAVAGETKQTLLYAAIIVLGVLFLSRMV